MDCCEAELVMECRDVVRVTRCREMLGAELWATTAEMPAYEAAERTRLPHHRHGSKHTPHSTLYMSSFQRSRPQGLNISL